MILLYELRPYSYIIMVYLKRAPSGNEEDMSRSRAVNASILTAATVIVALIWLFHGFWAFSVVYRNEYENHFTSFVYGPGSLVADIGLATKGLIFLNNRLLENELDTDHKKYI